MRSFLRLILVLLGFSLASRALANESIQPRLASERIVFRTTFGDIVLALYPDVAPKTVEQILKLTKLGVYDSVNIARIEPGFVVQLGDARDRGSPMTPEQSAAIHKIPAEFGNIRHRFGSLSMAHAADPNGAETSFSILLADAPHLDGKYTVFGRVERGFDVVGAIAHADIDTTTRRPQSRIAIDSTLIVNATEIDKLPLRSASAAVQANRVNEGAGSSARSDWNTAGTVSPVRVLVSLGIMALLGLATFLFAGRFSPKVIGSLGLLSVFVAFFLAFTILGPLAPTIRWLPVAMFVGTIGIFKLVNRFESPR